MSEQGWKDEMAGMRTIISNFANIPEDDIKGKQNSTFLVIKWLTISKLRPFAISNRIFIDNSDDNFESAIESMILILIKIHSLFD